MDSANTIVDAFRGFEDDTAGAITAQTAIAAVDTNWTQAVDSTFHVAFLITETVGVNEAVAARFEYSLNSGTWTTISNTSPIQFTTPTNCTTTTGASYGTTALTTGATILSTEYDLTTGDYGNTVLNNQSKEVCACLTIDSAQVADSDTLDVRVTDAGTLFSGDPGDGQSRSAKRLRIQMSPSMPVTTPSPAIAGMKVSISRPRLERIRLPGSTRRPPRQAIPTSH